MKKLINKKTFISMVAIIFILVVILIIYRITKPRLIFTVHTETRDYQGFNVIESGKDIIFSERDIGSWNWESGVIVLSNEFFDKYGNNPVFISSYPKPTVPEVLPSPTFINYQWRVYTLSYNGEILLKESIRIFPYLEGSGGVHISEHEKGVKINLSLTSEDPSLENLYEFLKSNKLLS